MLNITNRINISEDQLQFVFSRSSGPGGQNVNKLSTRVTLLLDIVNCPDLPPYHKNLIMTKLKTRINKEGVLRVIASKHRSQHANKILAVERLQELLVAALKQQPKRKKTKIPYSAKRKRLENKKHRSKIKELRTKPCE